MRSKRSIVQGALFSLAGVSVLIVSILILILSADPSPTTPDTRRLFGLWRLPHFLLSMSVLIFGIGILAYTRGRNAFLGFVTSLGSLLIFVIVLEGLGRAGILNWNDILHQSRAAGTGAGWSAQPNQKETGETYQDIATRVGLQSDPIAYEYESDSYGFRNPDGTPAEIILLGDSIVLGAQVDRSETVDAVLQGRLGRPVMQVALLGLSIQAQHDLLRTSGIDLSGKTVVQFLFEGNDLRDSASYRAQQAQEGRGAEVARSSFIRTVWGIAAKMTDPTPPLESADYCRIDGQPFLFLWLRRSFEGHMDELDHIQKAISVFAEEVRSKGGGYHLVFVPSKFRVLHPLCTFPEGSAIADASQHLSDLPKTMRSWSDDAGLPFFDLTAPLAEAAHDSRIPWLWGDTHWSAAGHAAAGQALAEWTIWQR